MKKTDPFKHILIYPSLFILSLSLFGCGNNNISNEEMQIDIVSVTLEENIELVGKKMEKSTASNNRYEVESQKKNSQSKKSDESQVKTLKKDEPQVATYKTYYDEDGNFKQEIYTTDASNFNISAPKGMRLYSLLSVKNMMTEDGKHGGAIIPYILLNEAESTFKFVFGSTDKYVREGNYESTDEILTLNSKSNTYVFDYKENGLLTFNEESSDKIPLENKKSFSIDKHSAFFPVGFGFGFEFDNFDESNEVVTDK